MIVDLRWMIITVHPLSTVYHCVCHGIHLFDSSVLPVVRLWWNNSERGCWCYSCCVFLVCNFDFFLTESFPVHITDAGEWNSVLRPRSWWTTHRARRLRGYGPQPSPWHISAGPILQQQTHGVKLSLTKVTYLTACLLEKRRGAMKLNQNHLPDIRNHY